jgi:YgiT-type zinc finger domain-containing protein
MERSLRTHQYTECGMSNVVLRGVPFYDCKNCGEQILSIPGIGRLHRALAFEVVQKPTRLLPAEVKFLRKYLGYSNRDFAKTMGVTPEQASRWTSEGSIGSSADRLLRMLVTRAAPIDQYPIERLQEIDDKAEPEQPIRDLVLESRNASWAPVRAA